MAEENEKTENQETEAAQTETTTATEAKEEPQTVPKERLDEVIKERDEANEAKAALETNVALMRANAPRAEGPKAEPFDIYKHVGLNPDDPDDIPTQAQQKEINAYLQGQVTSQMAQIRFLIDHPDYPQLVGTAEQIQAGQFAEPFKEAIKANPALMTVMATSQNPQVAAYEIAKLYEKNKAEGTKTTKTEAQAAIDEAVKNAAKVKSVSNTKGGEALTEEGRYESMSDEDFMKIAAKHGAVL